MPMQKNTKKILRNIYLEKRKNLSSGEWDALNMSLWQQLTAVDWNNFAVVHIFLPMRHSREPDTYAIGLKLKALYPHIRLVASKSYAGDHTMKHYVWDEETQLIDNQWGIPEPEKGILVSPREMDLVFVPLLAFDKQGHRVGYGKGFYDRFLVQCRPDTLKIGLSLFDPVDSISDAAAWDIPLDSCATPSGIWKFTTTGRSGSEGIAKANT